MRSVLEMRTLSRYTKQFGRLPRIWSIIPWKVNPAFCRPKGILSHYKRPKEVIPAILETSVVDIGYLIIAFCEINLDKNFTSMEP